MARLEPAVLLLALPLLSSCMVVGAAAQAGAAVASPLVTIATYRRSPRRRKPSLFERHRLCMEGQAYECWSLGRVFELNAEFEDARWYYRRYCALEGHPSDCAPTDRVCAALDRAKQHGTVLQSR